MGIAATVGLCVAVLARAALAGEPALVRSLGKATVDWEEGVITVQAGAAADPRLPRPEMIRPGAERRARAAAERKLRAVLSELPMGGGRRLDAPSIDEAVQRARIAALDYQSNGGVLLTIELRFAHLMAPRAAAPDAGPAQEMILSVPAMPLEATPTLLPAGKSPIRVWAVYRLGSPRKTPAVAVSRDAEGRLVLPAGGQGAADKVAGGRVVIYVEQIIEP